MDTATRVALITAAAALVGHLIVQYRDQSAKLENDVREKRVLMYADLLQITREALVKTERGDPFIRDANLTTRLIAWATPEVIIAITEVWQKLESTEKSHKELESAMSSLLASIRRDLGHDDKNAGDKFDVLIARLYLRKTAPPS